MLVEVEVVPETQVQPHQVGQVSGVVDNQQHFLRLQAHSTEAVGAVELNMRLAVMLQWLQGAVRVL